MAAPPEELKIHEKDIDDVIAEMQTDKVKGLTAAEAAKRLLEDGPNELEKPPRVSLLVLFLIQLNSVIMYLLMGAVVASAAIKATGDDKDQFLSYIDSIAITIIVFINASIAAKAENNANDALEALSSLQAPISTLIRDGEEIRVESSDIVRGDLVKLGTGDVVPRGRPLHHRERPARERDAPHGRARGCGQVHQGEAARSGASGEAHRG